MSKKQNHLHISKIQTSKAFTLIELLIVVVVIAILAAAVIIAITPGERVAQARDATRTSHLLAIQSALYVYQIDEEELPVAIPSSLTEICDTGAEQTGHSIDCGDLVDLSFLVPNHLPYIPKDPQGAVASIFLNYVYAAEGNGYKIAKSGDTISLEAPNAETRVVVVGAVEEEGESLELSFGDVSGLITLITNTQTANVDATIFVKLEEEQGMGPIPYTTIYINNVGSEVYWEGDNFLINEGDDIYFILEHIGPTFPAMGWAYIHLNSISGELVDSFTYLMDLMDDGGGGDPL